MATTVYLRLMAYQRRLQFWKSWAGRVRPIPRKRQAVTLVAYYERKIAELLAKNDLRIPL